MNLIEDKFKPGELIMVRKNVRIPVYGKIFLPVKEFDHGFGISQFKTIVLNNLPLMYIERGSGEEYASFKVLYGKEFVFINQSSYVSFDKLM